MKKTLLKTIIISFFALIIGLSFMVGGDISSSASESNSALDIDSINGDFIVETTKCDSSLVINDIETLKKAFEGYTTNQKLVNNAQIFLNMQNNYKVNAIFAAAVSIVETTAGTAGHAVCEGNCHNWFNYQPVNSMEKGHDRWAKFDNDANRDNGIW